NNLAGLLHDKGRYAEAEQLYRQALEAYQKSLKPDHWMIYKCRSSLGASLIKLKRYSEAEEQLLSGYSGLKANRGEHYAQTEKTVSRLIELYDSWGKPDKADPYRALFQSK